MEHLDSVMLGVLDICALVWYARQRARRWLLRLVWIAGAMLGFVLVGPLALVVWVAASSLFGPKDQASEVSEDDNYCFVEDMQIARETRKRSEEGARFGSTHDEVFHDPYVP